MKKQQLMSMVVAAMLCAISIAIPMFSPFKIILEPASFTLASHVAIFVAMFISPGIALAVAAGATVGFLLGGFPIVIVLRAASHLIFVLAGSLIIKKRPEVMTNKLQMIGFAVMISLVHAISEVAVVMPFYFGSSMPEGYYAKSFLVTIIGLVGVGTVVHSLVDFIIARAVWQPVSKIVARQFDTTIRTRA